MDKKILHTREDEAIEAKTRWFRSLSLSERMEILCTFTDLALSINPGIAEIREAKQAKKGVVLTKK